MKSFLTAFLILITLNVHSQCPTLNCNVTTTFPINVNDYNNSTGAYAGQGPNRCIYGTGTFSNNINEIGGWQFISFSGNITVAQAINVNTGKKVYSDGDIHFANLNMAGGNDSAIMYVAGGSEITVSNITANNLKNYVFLGPGATFKIGGSFYNVGDTYQGPGNNTNVVTFLACGGTGLRVEDFKYENGLLMWDLKKLSLVSLQISQDGKNFETIKSFLPQVYKYYVIDPGYYRIITNDGYISKVIPILLEEESPKVKRVILYRINNLNATKIIK